MKPFLLLLLLFVLSAPAAQGQTPRPAGRAASASPRPLPLAKGEVLEVDRKERRVLIKHGPIQSIGMDAMTMEFLVPDARLLASLQPGDSVRFAATWKDGDYLLTRAQVVKRRGARPAAGGRH